MSGRKCGDCTLCCRLLPVHEGVKVEHAFTDAHVVAGYKLNAMLPPFDKAAGERCKHQCSKGCRVHGTAKMPRACHFFGCAWLFNWDADDMHRPDRAGFVVDPTTDAVMINGTRIPVVQIWLDPRRPDAWKDDAALRRYLTRRAKDGLGAILRYDESKASVLLAPAQSPTGAWYLTEPRPANAKMGEI